MQPRDFRSSSVPVCLSCRSLFTSDILGGILRDFLQIRNLWKSASCARRCIMQRLGMKVWSCIRISLDRRSQRWKLSYQIIPPCQGRLISCDLLVLLSFTDVFLSSAPKACPSFLVGRFLGQLQSWCGVTYFTCLYWFIPGVWCGGSANSKSELCCTMCCFNSLGSMQLPFPSGNRQDVRSLGNSASLENYWRDWNWLLRYLTMFF